MPSRPDRGRIYRLSWRPALAGIVGDGRPSMRCGVEAPHSPVPGSFDGASSRFILDRAVQVANRRSTGSNLADNHRCPGDLMMLHGGTLARALSQQVTCVDEP
jgi:hypothetical protein